MKKVCIIILGLLLTIYARSVKKSCNYLNDIPYGTSFEIVKSLLGEYASKTKIQDGTNSFRCTYVLCRYNSSVVTDNYYITYTDNKVVERGVTNRTKSEFIKIPFDVEFSESLDNIENARIWQTSHMQQEVERLSVNKKKENNIIESVIPRILEINDNVFLVNKSSCTIMKAVVVNALNHSQVLGSCGIVSPKETVQMAAYSNNALSFWRGVPIDIKIKGYMGDPATLLTDDSDKITYDFSVYIYAEKHDLYISVESDKSESQTDIMDF